MSIDYEGMSKEEAEQSRIYHEEAYVNMSMKDPSRIDLAIRAYRKDLELRYGSQKRQNKRIPKVNPTTTLAIASYMRENWTTTRELTTYCLSP